MKHSSQTSEPFLSFPQLNTAWSILPVETAKKTRQIRNENSSCVSRSENTELT